MKLVRRSHSRTSRIRFGISGLLRRSRFEFVSDFGFRICLLAVFLTLVPTALAHEARPAYLEIKETSPNQFSVLWRTPDLAGMRLPVVLTMPGDVKNLKEPVEQELADSLLERQWIDAGANGLAGKRIEFRGLQATITDVLVRVEMLDGRTWTTIARPSQPWVQIAASQTWLEVAVTYIVQGIRHILFGLDHLLFILGLMLSLEYSLNRGAAAQQRKEIREVV